MLPASSKAKKQTIEKFMKEYATLYVSNKNEKDIEKTANAIMETGIKEKDAYHVACAVIAECNYFVTTDDRLLKYQSEKIEPTLYCQPILQPEYMYISAVSTHGTYWCFHSFTKSSWVKDTPVA